MRFAQPAKEAAQNTNTANREARTSCDLRAKVRERAEPVPAPLVDGLSELDLFFDAGSLAAEIAQVVELRSAHITTSFHLDFRDSGTVSLEHTLYPLAV